ncbi:MAG TPA: TPM domain-containing protein [Candidatus Limnocylindrales bacterium]|nr:TPM domain-containing protein [Candidatus Limnocylindrales bacterium]
MKRHRTSRLALAGWLAAGLLLLTAAAVGADGHDRRVPPGPPYPSPAADRVVYDFAGAFRPGTLAEATRIISAIEARTGAEVVVYTQVKPESDTPDAAERDAIALMDQWGVGRRGFDDGLVILFDLDQSLVHGQVQLYAGPGFRASFLSNAERQAIFEQRMLPHLRAGDLDRALLEALAAVDANATPEHARRLEQARFVDAALGLVLAPLAFVLLSGWALLAWWRYGRDPEYLDDPSIHMPSPPPELSAAGGTLIQDGRASQRTLTTALLDLASRGALSFRTAAEGTVWLQLLDAASVDDADVERARRRPIGAAEEGLLRALHGLAEGFGVVPPEALTGLAGKVPDFEGALEAHLVAKGWFREAPARARSRWRRRGALVLAAGLAVLFLVGQGLPSGGASLLGGGIAAAGVVILAVAPAMPARTMVGAMLRAMLAAYRRTLSKLLAQARSMRDVVESGQVPWLETPDQAVVWGVALGLHEEIQRVLDRSLEDLEAGRATPERAWLPAWYAVSGGSDGGGSASGPIGVVPGLFSSGGMPNVGGMMAVLGGVGAAASSDSGSSDGGSGGFGGGSSGGGGGGAGGGF